MSDEKPNSEEVMAIGIQVSGRVLILPLGQVVEGMLDFFLSRRPNAEALSEEQLNDLQDAYYAGACGVVGILNSLNCQSTLSKEVQVVFEAIRAELNAFTSRKLKAIEEADPLKGKTADQLHNPSGTVN